jgi:hypothetical protein
VDRVHDHCESAAQSGPQWTTSGADKRVWRHLVGAWHVSATARWRGGKVWGAPGGVRRLLWGSGEHQGGGSGRLSAAVNGVNAVDCGAGLRGCLNEGFKVGRVNG